MDNKQTYAIVTGASRGIGTAISRSILRQGGRVIGTARRSSFPEDLVDNERFRGIRADLASKDDLEKELRPLFEEEEAPNVLINNAGISEPSDMDDPVGTWLENWDRTMQINLRAPALLSKWALNRWKEEGSGLLINISSRAAYRGDTQEFASYAASKGGLAAFTKSVARDFGRHGISAYTVAPGFIKTDMAMEVIDVYGEEYLTQGSSFDEVTSPGEVGDLVAFLASGKVKHMTGSTLHINGGSYMV